MKEEGVVSRSDVEMGSNEDFQEELKRNLGARHINMIAIAGMIVRFLTPESLEQADGFRELDCFLALEIRLH